MSNCTRCGAYIPMGDTACPACGYDPEKEKAEQKQSGFSGGAAQARQETGSTDQTSGSYRSRAQEEEAASGSYRHEETAGDAQSMTWAPWNSREEEQHTDYTVYDADEGESERIRRLSVLSYVGPLFLLPLWLHKDNDFVRFHANQGLVLFLAELVVKICLGGPLWLAGVGFCLYCLVKGAKAAAAGQRVKLPWIGGIELIK